MLKLMIVDDEYNTREGLKHYVPWLDLGIDTLCDAEDGYSALNVFNKENPDIILCDVKMPRMSGLDLSGILVKKNPECKIIFLSGYSDKEFLKAAIKCGAVDYIEKPVNMSELRDVVTKAVNMLKKNKKDKHINNYEMPEGSDNDIVNRITNKLLRADNMNASRKTNDIKHFIRNNYCNSQLSMLLIAENVDLSLNYMCNKFKKETGSTINNYITNIRILEACKLLRNSDLNICEITYKTGFLLPNYFSRIFKLKTGLSPSEFRNLPVYG